MPRPRRKHPALLPPPPPQNSWAAPLPRRDRYTPLIRWRATGRELPYLHTEELPSLVYELLDALTQPGQAPSDRTVGRFLRDAITRLGQVPFPYPESEPPQPHHAEPPSASAAFPPSNPADLAQLQREMATLFATLTEAQQP